MADFLGTTSASAGVTTYSIRGNEGSEEAYQRGTSQIAFSDRFDEDGLTDGELSAEGVKTNKVVGTERLGVFMDQGFPDWFENFHVIPRSVTLGNVFSETTQAFQIHSGFRRLQGTWSSFTNNAGAGVTLTGGPSLPATMYPQEDYGATLTVSTSGPASVDSTLDFGFSGGITISVPITLQRLVLFPIRPEIPYRETLGFLTDIIEADDGTEQRIALRKNPRQFFEWNVALDSGTFDQSRTNALLFDWQARTWGVPVWHESTDLTVASLASATTFNVSSTANADYRVGSLFMVYEDSQTFDVLEISALTATTITAASGAANAYSAGAYVTPLRQGNLERNVSSSRFRSMDQTLQLRFRIKDNDANLADTSAFGTYNSKVLLDSCNVARNGSVAESFTTALIVIDNNTGQVFQDPTWTRGKRGTTLTLSAHTKAEVWDLRELMHAIRGRQISFYVPTFAKDLLPDNDLTSGSPDLDVVNVGYVQFIQDRQPKNHVWVRLLDGTTYTREVLSSVETTSTRETLTLDANWPGNIAQADIDRISFLEEVRFESDEIQILHERGERLVYFTAPVITTFD